MLIKQEYWISKSCGSYSCDNRNDKTVIIYLQ